MHKDLTQSKAKTIISYGIYPILTAVCLLFVAWIGRMSYDNTCVSLKEEYIAMVTQAQINSIENSLNFGREFENYYGMDELLSSICEETKAGVELLVISPDGTPRYTTLSESEESISLLTMASDANFLNRARNALYNESGFEAITMGDKDAMIFPILVHDVDIVGYMVAIYEQSHLAEISGSQENFIKERGVMLLVFILVIFAALTVLRLVVKGRKISNKWYVRYAAVAIIMGGMLLFILSIYRDYEQKYANVVSINADDTAHFIANSIDSLQKKGLLLDDIEAVSEYIKGFTVKNKSIESIAVVMNYYDTNSSSTIISIPIKNKKAFVNVSVNQSFLKERSTNMRLVFGAIFVICLMITYEIVRAAHVLLEEERVTLTEVSDSSDELFGTEDCEHRRKSREVGVWVRLLAFLTYTALYTSMPYAAVIMRNWKATVFGLSDAVSASLPLTVELLSVLLVSLLIQKVFRDSKLDTIKLLALPVLIICNISCGYVNSPYLLLALRALCGVGFAFLKYWLNSLVAAGSYEDRDIQKNYAQLNGGLLCGITIGASLGSVLAASKGYQFNYLFTAIICFAVLILTSFLLQTKDWDANRIQQLTQAQKANVSWAKLLRNKGILGALLLGDVPLNIGLMYVVSFLPVYMSAVGQSEVATSYAYLINGVAGVYVGVLLIKLLKNVSTYVGSVITFVMCGVGILVLVVGPSTGMIMLSAGILGLFDGYGTPTITGFFTSSPAAKDTDKASLLTVYNSVGSGVQIICPLLYNVIIQPDGKTTYLFIFGICYLIIAALFFMTFGGKSHTSGVKGENS